MAERDHLEFEIDLSKLCIVSSENGVLYQPEIKVFFNDHLQRTEEWVRMRTGIPGSSEHGQCTNLELEAACSQPHIQGIKTISQVIEEREKANKQREERQQIAEEQEYTCSASFENEGREKNYVLISDKFYKLEHARAVIKEYLERKPEPATPIHRLICSKSLDDLCKASAEKVIKRSLSFGDLQSYHGTESENFLSWLRQSVPKSPKIDSLPCCSTTENSKERPTSMWNEFDEVHPVYSSESVSSGDSDGEHFLVIKDGYACATIKSGNEIKSTNTDIKPKSFRRRFLSSFRRVFKCFSCCRKPECDD